MTLALRKIDCSPYIDELKEAGFTEKQARGVIRFQYETNNDSLEHLVTKDQFDEALKHLATKNDLIEVKNELKLEMGEMKTDFKWLKYICLGAFMTMIVNMLSLGIHH